MSAKGPPVVLLKSGMLTMKLTTEDRAREPGKGQSAAVSIPGGEA